MDDDVKLTVRLPKGLHAALVRMAEVERRSLNSQIIHLLSQQQPRQGR
jgi:predicted HicB family RNase H-like nuclease